MANIISKKSGPLTGTADIPGDKSISQRAAILASLAEGTTEIHGYIPGEDGKSTLQAVGHLGARVEKDGDHIIVHGVGRHGYTDPNRPLDLGNSGTGLRLLMGAVAGQDVFAVFTGDGSLSQRPMDRISQPLARMGAVIDGRGGGHQLPIALRGGGLKGRNFSLPVASAQVKSALLLAGLGARGVTSIAEPGPSRDHTERMLPLFGVSVETDHLTTRLEGPQGLTAPGVLRVPKDPSSAAFIAVAAAISPGSKVTMEGVSLNKTRIGWIEVMQAMGVAIETTVTGDDGGDPTGTVTVMGPPLRAASQNNDAAEVVIEGELIPRTLDEIPILAVLATQIKGKTVVRDAQELRVKETDRLDAIAVEWSKLGMHVDLTTDGFVIEGPQKVAGGVGDARGDHRMAMALAVAGLTAEDAVKVKGASCISVSFPGFVHTLKALGANVDWVEN